MKRVKTGTMINPLVIKMCDDNKTKANVKSRNDFIEKAIKHYVEYLNISNNDSFLEQIVTVFESQINSSEKKINNFLFKVSIELCMIMNIIASYFEVENSTLELLRNKCIEDVKKSIGNVDLIQIFENQKDNRNG